MHTNLGQRFETLVWGAGLNQRPYWLRLFIHAARLGYAVSRDIASGQLTLRAMSLVFTTLLSLVPLLALSFSILKGLGAHYKLEPLLLTFLAPLGDRAGEIVDLIVGFVDNVKIGVLGALGVVFLVWTVINLMQKTEEAFNYIWKVPQPRSLQQTISRYFTVILIAPLLLFFASGLATAENTGELQKLLGDEWGSLVVNQLGNILPFLMTWAAFSFINSFVPNTPVQLKAAVIGGLIAAISWDLTAWAFINFVSGSAQREAIYAGSAFAIIIVLLLWIHIGWLILLIGANIAFYVQHPQYLRFRNPPTRLVGRQSERVALAIMFLLARRHHRGARPWTTATLARRLGLPQQAIAHSIALLADEHLAIAVGDDDGWVPGRDIAGINAANIVAAVRGEQANNGPTRLGDELRLADDLLDDAEAEALLRLNEKSLAEMLDEADRERDRETSEPADEPLAV